MIYFGAVRNLIRLRRHLLHHTALLSYEHDYPFEGQCDKIFVDRVASKSIAIV